MKFQYKYSDNLKCATRGEQRSKVEVRTIEAESKYDAMVKIFAILQQDEYFLIHSMLLLTRALIQSFEILYQEILSN